MFRPQRKSIVAPRARTTAQTVSIPTPIMGLNVRDSVAQMDPRYAVEMENFWPTAWGVQVRRGWQRYVEMGNTIPIRTLMVYYSPAGVETMFAVNSSGVFDVTAGNVAPVLKHAVTDAYVQHVNFTNVFGTFLVCVNGFDTPFHFNGTTWANIAITNDAVADALTLNPNNLIDIIGFKRRLWFVEKDSTRAWYLPTDVIQGQVSLFDLGEVFPRGGFLADIGTWTVDSGTGINDMLVFVSSEGDIALFSGIDPDVDFALVGIFDIAHPLGRRSMAKRGGDLLMATQEGVVSLAAVMQEQSEGSARTITDLIKPLLSNITVGLVPINERDWQLVAVGRYEMLLYNTADQVGVVRQFAMNVTTKAWTQFTNVPAHCWGILNGEPFFGGDGFVGQFWTTAFDGGSADGNVEGSFVEGRLIQAFQYFGSAGQQKHFRMVRPLLRGSTPPSVALSITPDYIQYNPNIADDPALLGFNFAIWNSSLWDQSLWALAYAPFSRWYNVGAIGMSGAIAISLKCATIDMLWLASDIVMEPGGTL